MEISDDAIITKGSTASFPRGIPVREGVFGYPRRRHRKSDHDVDSRRTTWTRSRDSRPAAARRTIDHYETVRRRKDGTLFNVS